MIYVYNLHIITYIDKLLIQFLSGGKFKYRHILQNINTQKIIIIIVPINIKSTVYVSIITLQISLAKRTDYDDDK